MANRASRARFQADLISTAEAQIPFISRVRKVDAGQCSLEFAHPLLGPSAVELLVVLPEDLDYPHEHYFLAYATDEAPESVSRCLDDFLTKSNGLRLGDAIEVLSRSLCLALGGDTSEFAGVDKDGNSDMAGLEDDDFDEEEEFDDFDVGDEDNAAFGLDDNMAEATHSLHSATKISPEELSRVRRDLVAVRRAGFKVARLCGFVDDTAYSILCVSINVEKLCLSDETREAWNLGVEDYVVLLVRYFGTYQTFEKVVSRPPEFSNMQFRLRRCSRYKPSLEQANAAFSSQDTSSIHSNQHSGMAVAGAIPDLGLLGVGKTIDTFMDSEFVSLLKLKAAHSIHWDAAKSALVNMMRLINPTEEELDSVVLMAGSGTEEKADSTKVPAFLLSDWPKSVEKSLPLISAQFAMRYLVRCTDYCMVCHRRVEGNFEALKPYVCGDSLCLFQYMSLGYGPNIEHEILSQPNVVDLLVSFCFAALQAAPSMQRANTAPIRSCSLREFPNGLSLMVPNIRSPSAYSHVQQSKPAPAPKKQKLADGGVITQEPGVAMVNAVDVVFDWDTSTMTFVESSDVSAVKEGNWVAIATSSSMSEYSAVHHARVESIIQDSVKLLIVARHGLPISPASQDETSLKSLCHYAGPAKAKMVTYSKNMDDLPDEDKAFIMSVLLATIPPIAVIRSYLLTDRNRQIEKWTGLSPAAAKLLRWIVASNRSYIVQVGEISTGDDDQPSGLARPREQIIGIDDWLQFRFAQGSPEKEMRFQEELKTVPGPHGTLVAWHGSRMSNWHSIIRQGLNFDEIHSGRAFGNGVYFSKSFDYSMGYAHGHHGTTAGGGMWPNSALKIQAALSLNELINKPGEFVHNQSCYVVQHTHWIQCRYLFVRPQAALTLKSTVASAAAEPMFEQAPAWVATGPQHQPISIPKFAITSLQDKTLLLSKMQQAEGHGMVSDDEDAEDIDFLLGGEGDSSVSLRARPSDSGFQLVSSETDFRPGAVDISTLPKLNPPSYATDQAQRTIGREIQNLQRVQSSTPLHQLGWFIDFENLDNMFHWIVELHTFDPDLPLAQDMKKAGLKSVVLEIRFGRDFPMSPPFVRVIRPRFLPFMNGGGGHVTAGGAMCMELLTNSGWSPASSLESVLLQVRMAICSTDPKPARLQVGGQGLTNADYGVSEAFDAYVRAARAHGWLVPDDLQQTTTGMTTAGAETEQS